MRSLALFFVLLALPAAADELMTDAVKFVNPPPWLTESMVNKAAGRAQNLLEWDIRRVVAYWYTDSGEFERSHGLGKAVIAYFRRKDSTMHFGPQVTKENFDEVATHEFSHVIVFQKYKGAIPAWLEEGLANHTANKTSIDYKRLLAHPIADVKKLEHPFATGEDPHIHYMASTALIELIASKCGLADMLQLSVGKKLETYLDTFCNIKDINAEYRDWVAKKAGTRAMAAKKK